MARDGTRQASTAGNVDWDALRGTAADSEVESAPRSLYGLLREEGGRFKGGEHRGGTARDRERK